MHIQPSIDFFENMATYAHVVQIMGVSKLANLWRIIWKNFKLIKHFNEEEKLHDGGKRDSCLKKREILENVSLLLFGLCKKWKCLEIGLSWCENNETDNMGN